MKKFLKDLFSDQNGKPSLFRIIFFVLFLIVTKSLIVNEKIVNAEIIIAVLQGLIIYIFASKTRINKRD